MERERERQRQRQREGVRESERDRDREKDRKKQTERDRRRDKYEWCKRAPCYMHRKVEMAIAVYPPTLLLPAPSAAAGND